MGENSWIIDNLNAALNTWNEKAGGDLAALAQGLADFGAGGGVECHAERAQRDDGHPVWACWCCSSPWAW